MDVAPKVAMSSSSSLSFRLITRRQENRSKAVFCLDLCLKIFALKNDRHLHIYVSNYGLKEEESHNGAHNHFSVFSSVFFLIAKTITQFPFQRKSVGNITQ